MAKSKQAIINEQRDEITQMKKFIEENNVLGLAEDLNYRMAILDGTWPQSVEILTIALEHAKTLKGK